ncbi:hypothetical protein IC582_001021 [Cucumis melo]
MGESIECDQGLSWPESGILGLVMICMVTVIYLLGLVMIEVIWC